MTLLLGWTRSIGSLAGSSGQSAILDLTDGWTITRESSRRGKCQRGRVHSTSTRGITTPLSLSGHAAGLPAEIARMPKSWPERLAHAGEREIRNNEASTIALLFNTWGAEDIELTAEVANAGTL